jgi:signal peptidase I
MGDNRDNSADSRILSGVGYVPLENLVGRAEFIFFSTDGSAIRSSRLFRGVN